MIEKLTIEKLKKYGFSTESIERFSTWEITYEAFYHSGYDCIFASNKDNKIYSGIEGFKKYYFRDGAPLIFPKHCADLIEEYYFLALSKYLEKKKRNTGTKFNDKVNIEKFNRQELISANNTLEKLSKSNLLKFNTVNGLIKKEIDIFEAYVDWLNGLVDSENSTSANIQIQQNIIQSSDLITPIFKSEAVQTVFDLLKNFFSREHQMDLENILKNGTDAPQKLIFLDRGNRLADAFKQLIKADIITGCEQKELEYWIYKNFQYKNQTVKDYTIRYLNDIISSNKDRCQRPILNTIQDRTTGNYSINKA